MYLREFPSKSSREEIPFPTGVQSEASGSRAKRKPIGAEHGGSDLDVNANTVFDAESLEETNFGTKESQWWDVLINEDLLVNRLGEDPALVDVNISESDPVVMRAKSYLEQQASTPLYDGAPMSRLSTILLFMTYLQVKGCSYFFSKSK